MLLCMRRGSSSSNVKHTACMTLSKMKLLRMLCLCMLCLHPSMSMQLGARCRETRFDADMEEALVSSKLDAIGQEYNLLLAGQLEEQRRWYDGRHAQVHIAAFILHVQSAQSV
jgi:hypothetical protein